ncbi:MAG: glycosyl hydrolase [Planctomycetaceae bacterium]|nr:glycosyl hydrolase [Planctomycetaceae bacterium]
MKATTSVAVALLISFSLLNLSLAGNPNSLTPKEKAAGFALLFNGKDFQGWKQSGNWIVDKDGSISREKLGGSLVYQVAKIPNNFELRFQWKVAKGSNSGVYYRPGQYEYQILDNAVHVDGKNPRTSAASLYFCMAPSHDATRPVGEWNHGAIICKGSVIQHWLNGKKVIGFDYKDKEWAWNVDLLDKRGGKLAARGAFLSLQDHGDPVWYRGIKLRELKADDKIDESSVKPAEISKEVLEAEAKKLEGILKRRKKVKK